MDKRLLEIKGQIEREEVILKTDLNKCMNDLQIRYEKKIENLPASISRNSMLEIGSSFEKSMIEAQKAIIQKIDEFTKNVDNSFIRAASWQGKTITYSFQELITKMRYRQKCELNWYGALEDYAWFQPKRRLEDIIEKEIICIKRNFEQYWQEYDEEFQKCLKEILDCCGYNDEMLFLTSSLDLSEHPMNQANIKLKKKYYLVLEEIVKKQLDNKYTRARLEQYRTKLMATSSSVEKCADIKRIARSIINNRLQPWKKEYRYWLMCDAVLILMDGNLINKAAEEMTAFLSQRQQQKFEVLLNALRDNNVDISSIAFAEGLITQYRRNRAFAENMVRKFIVTANMSAGKSTLINALIGKPLAKTSQEVCTGNICYLYNKPYEDDRVHLENQSYSLHAGPNEIKNILWEKPVMIASYFRWLSSITGRFCIIDTPGVNSAVNRKHGKMSHEVLKNEKYEKVIYILNANKLGTDEEIEHIKWISQNVPRNKVIFVLNKVDDFKIVDDDLSASLKGVRDDLISLGFENPRIYPICAYFALLIKMKGNGDEMTDDERDEYSFYCRKFNKPAYDLSKYYEDSAEENGDNETIAMSKKCGLYGLEKIIFGGTL